jgi:serine/threonine protein kinase
MKRPLEESTDATLVPTAVLGKGGFGCVQKAYWVEKNMTVAVKTCSSRARSAYTAEVRALEKLKDNPFIVELHTTFSNNRGFHLVLELCKGGDLYTVLTQNRSLNEHAFFYVVELVHVLSLLHEGHVVYGDMKLENVGVDASGHIKLFDFGVTSLDITEVDRGITDVRGTELYMAPEMHWRARGGTAVDVWALACIIVELYTLTPISPHSPLASVAEDETLDPVVKDLLTSMFHSDPRERFTMKQVKEHKLFHSVCWKAVAERTWQKPPFVPHDQVVDPVCRLAGAAALLT